MEVDFDAENSLKAKKEERKINNVKFRPIHHGHDVMHVLKVSNERKVYLRRSTHALEHFPGKRKVASKYN
jgi:hypothetical protein